MKSNFPHFYLFSARLEDFSPILRTFSGFSGLFFMSVYYIPDTSTPEMFQNSPFEAFVYTALF